MGGGERKWIVNIDEIKQNESGETLSIGWTKMSSHPTVIVGA